MKLVITNTTASISDKSYRSKDNRTVLRHGERVYIENEKGDRVPFYIRRVLNKKLLILEEQRNTNVRYSASDIIQLVIKAFQKKL